MSGVVCKIHASRASVAACRDKKDGVCESYRVVMFKFFVVFVVSSVVIC